MVVFDRNMYGIDGNYAVWLWQVCPPEDPGAQTSAFCLTDSQHLSHPTQWTAHGIDVSYLSSNGLPGCWPRNYSGLGYPQIEQTGEINNDGHFGVPAPYQAIRYNEVVQAGTNPAQPIPHMLKVTLPNSIIDPLHRYFPSSKNDGISGDVPEGVVLRIKPSVTLTASMFQNPDGTTNYYTWAIALTLKKYGAIVGDTDGLVATVRLENLAAEHSTHTWSQLQINDSGALKGVPLDDYEFLYRGYGGPSVAHWNLRGGACEDEPIPPP